MKKKKCYDIPIHRFRELRGACLQYEQWMSEYRALVNGGNGAIQNDGMPHSTRVGRPTEAKGCRAAELSAKVDKIRQAANGADPILADYILINVTNEGVSYEYLAYRFDVPCSRATFYRVRRKFYFLLDKLWG